MQAPRCACGLRSFLGHHAHTCMSLNQGLKLLRNARRARLHCDRGTAMFVEVEGVICDCAPCQVLAAELATIEKRIRVSLEAH